MTAIDPATLSGNWTFPTMVRFGPGRIRELGGACAAARMARPLVVTDPGLAEHEIGRTIEACLTDAGLRPALFSDLRPNPTGEDVERGVEALRQGGHDGVVALGGGSGLDAAKAIAFMAGQTRPLWDFEDIGDHWTRASTDGILPIVAVPTTAGTGSEVGRAAVITRTDDHAKVIVFHPQMLPAQVIADPELTLGLPPHLTAWTGMDALAHSLEAYSAPGFHPPADGIAVEGIRLVHQWLKIAVADGLNLQARAHMLAAASLGAIAFQKGLGAMHALAHPIGGHLDSHHGLTVAVVMPYVLEENRAEIEARAGRLARMLGLEEASLDALIAWVLDLRRTFEIPNDLRGIGVEESHIPLLAPRAAVDPTGGGNPKKLDETGFAVLYRRALAGELRP
jgi:alcohol dehydrogenase class IV